MVSNTISENMKARIQKKCSQFNPPKVRGSFYVYEHQRNDYLIKRINQ